MSTLKNKSHETLTFSKLLNFKNLDLQMHLHDELKKKMYVRNILIRIHYYLLTI